MNLWLLLFPCEEARTWRLCCQKTLSPQEKKNLSQRSHYIAVDLKYILMKPVFTFPWFQIFSSWLLFFYRLIILDCGDFLKCFTEEWFKFYLAST